GRTRRQRTLCARRRRHVGHTCAALAQHAGLPRPTPPSTRSKQGDPHMHSFRFDPVTLPPEVEELRQEVREFLAEQLAAKRFTPHRNSWGTADPEFSRACGERGYIGMVWPKEYGGHERSALERYVVTEEMLAAGAPVG